MNTDKIQAMNSKEHQKHDSTSHRDIIIRQKQEILQLVFATEPDAIQSAVNTLCPQNLVMTNLQYLMGILVFIPPPQKILLLGVGAGSLIHFFRHYLPQSNITGVDIDEELIHLAQAQMMLPKAGEKLEFIINDAQKFMAECSHQYDLIVVDIFDGSQSPDNILAKEFTDLVKSCLSEKGAVAYNLLINSETVFSSFYKLLRRTYQNQTLCLETEEYENILLYALNFKSRNSSMMDNLQLAMEIQDQYQLPMTEILSTIYDINPIDSGII